MHTWRHHCLHHDVPDAVMSIRPIYKQRVCTAGNCCSAMFETDRQKDIKWVSRAEIFGQKVPDGHHTSEPPFFPLSMTCGSFERVPTEVTWSNAVPPTE